MTRSNRSPHHRDSPAAARPTRAARRITVAAAIALSIGLGACASKGAPPLEQIATARAAIAQAESAGAAQNAPLELLASRDKLGKAEAAVREEKFMQARELADESQADAALAESKARVATAQAAVKELARSNQQLGREAQRGGTPPPPPPQ